MDSKYEQRNSINIQTDTRQRTHFLLLLTRWLMRSEEVTETVSVAAKDDDSYGVRDEEIDSTKNRECKHLDQFFNGSAGLWKKLQRGCRICSAF